MPNGFGPRRAPAGSRQSNDVNLKREILELVSTSLAQCQSRLVADRGRIKQSGAVNSEHRMAASIRVPAGSSERARLSSVKKPRKAYIQAPAVCAVSAQNTMDGIALDDALARSSRSIASVGGGGRHVTHG